MQSLYLSAPFPVHEVPSDDGPEAQSTRYRVALFGILALCEQHRWSVFPSKDVSGYGPEPEEHSKQLRTADVFVALRFAHMRMATMPTYELANAVQQLADGTSRPALVLKLEPTSEFDELWVGQPGAEEFIGDPRPMLERLAEVLAA